MRFVVLAVLFSTLGCGRTAPESQGACDCAPARRHNEWCAACDTGWVAGFRVESRTLFDALDAHGHDASEPSEPSQKGGGTITLPVPPA